MHKSTFLRFILQASIVLYAFLVLNGCGEENNSFNPTSSNVNEYIYSSTKKLTPTLVIIMNWDNYIENDPSIWYDKIFNLSNNSVNRWYNETTLGEIGLIPVDETSGTINDGIIIVDMNKSHPGGANDLSFRDIEIVNAITNSEVVNNVDFAALDLDGDRNLNSKELQIIFIVAGGEESYGDPSFKSIWAHAWTFDSDSTLKVDGVYVMKNTGDISTLGTYCRFGAMHGDHKATIGIMAHELGHSLFNLYDYYDDGGGSGLGWYDIMSGGSWAMSTTDTYDGETPTQFSAYNRLDAKLNTKLSTLNRSNEITIKCDSGDIIKLLTSKANEYFLIECRDTAKANSDISLNYSDSSFTDDRLFAMIYHVDIYKNGNNQDGLQTATNHYKVALVENDDTVLMTSKEGINADFIDVYNAGDKVSISKTILYDGTYTYYAIDVISSNYTDRTMTIKITK
jgi:M6 family metalloprotease-like protein